MSLTEQLEVPAGAARAHCVGPAWGLAKAQANVRRSGEVLLARVRERERQEEKARGQVFLFEQEGA